MKLHYFLSRNFGDALSPLLVGKLTGKQVPCADAADADLVGIGSVFYSGHWLYRSWRYAHSARGFLSCLKAKSKCRVKPITVWGSGFLQDAQDAAPVFRLRKVDIAAVRGKLTQAILKRLNLVERGGGYLAGADAQKICSGVHELLSDEKALAKMAKARSPYGDGRAAERITEIVSKN